MGTFELENVQTDVVGTSKRTKDECIIALKVYDSCRQQDCLTPQVLGPARAAECTRLDGIEIGEGEVIIPPDDAVAVTIENLRLKKVVIVDKEPNAFRPGFWDIDLKYVFRYRLVFFDVNGERLDSIRATNIFNKKVTLFGSIGTEIVLASDLLCRESDTVEADPFVLVEGKAVSLAAELRFPKNLIADDNGRRPTPQDLAANEILVTIGLFTIIKLFRLVNLVVESKGFCVPPECEDISPLNPCEFFDNLEFPLSIFDPPQKEDFNRGAVLGVSNNRPEREKKPCGCRK